MKNKKITIEVDVLSVLAFLDKVRAGKAEEKDIPVDLQDAYAEANMLMKQYSKELKS